VSKRPWWLLPSGRVHPAWWIGLGAVLLWLDYPSGPGARFPLVYTIPVIIAAWYSGKWAALGLAVAVPLLRLAALATPLSPPDPIAFVLATLSRGVVVVLIGLWFARLGELERDLERRVAVLEGLLPICSFCKNIRNETGQWERIETYISGRSEAQFSHGVCPSCRKIEYPDNLDDK
jgi:hypothetical protein